MDTSLLPAVIVAVSILAWLLVSTLLAVVLGRMIRNADRDTRRFIQPGGLARKAPPEWATLR